MPDKKIIIAKILPHIQLFVIENNERSPITIIAKSLITFSRRLSGETIDE